MNGNGSSPTHRRAHRGSVTGKRRLALRVEVERRRRLVLDMAIAGATPSQIAEAVLREGMAPTPTKPGAEPRYTRSDASHDLNAAVSAITAVPAYQYKAMQLRRLGQVQAVLMRDILAAPDSDMRARSANALARQMEREARLTGIDEPVRSELEITAHFELLASISAAAVAAGAEAAGLSMAQREALTAGMQGYLAEIEGPRAEVVEVEAVDAEVVEEEAG